jgi:hypothetical protein
MSPNSARLLVLVSSGLMFAAIGLRRDRIDDVFKYAWAAGVITLGLSVLADTVPEVAGPAAVLVLMAVYWRNRGVIGAGTPIGALAKQQAAGASSTSTSSSSSSTTAPQPGHPA